MFLAQKTDTDSDQLVNTEQLKSETFPAGAEKDQKRKESEHIWTDIEQKEKWMTLFLCNFRTFLLFTKLASKMMIYQILSLVVTSIFSD